MKGSGAAAAHRGEHRARHVVAGVAAAAQRPADVKHHSADLIWQGQKGQGVGGAAAARGAARAAAAAGSVRGRSERGAPLPWGAQWSRQRARWDRTLSVDVTARRHGALGAAARCCASGLALLRVYPRMPASYSKPLI